MSAPSPTELELNGHRYQLGTIDVMRQFHVMRRITPAISALGLSLSELAKVGPIEPGEEGSGADDLAFKVASPVLDVIAKMSDADVDYVLKACMSGVRRQDSGRWVPIYNGTAFQYLDVTLPTMTRLAIEMIRTNLGDFFGPLLGTMPTGTPS